MVQHSSMTHCLRLAHPPTRMLCYALPCCAALCPHRYENIVQIRALYEGVSVQDMLDTWHKLLPRKMKEWSLDRQEVRFKRVIFCWGVGLCRVWRVLEG